MSNIDDDVTLEAELPWRLFRLVSPEAAADWLGQHGQFAWHEHATFSIASNRRDIVARVGDSRWTHGPSDVRWRAL